MKNKESEANDPMDKKNEATAPHVTFLPSQDSASILPSNFRRKSDSKAKNSFWYIKMMSIEQKNNL